MGSRPAHICPASRSGCKMSKSEREAQGLTTWQAKLRLEQTFIDSFRKRYSALYGYMEDDLRPGTQLKVIARDGYYLAMAQRWDEDRYFIVFGRGERMLEALLDLNKAMSADSWRYDKFANDV